MSSSYVFVLCILAIVMCASVARSYLQHKSAKPEPDAEIGETLAKIEVLEERIRVLERIVTENKFDLGREIDRLK